MSKLNWFEYLNQGKIWFPDGKPRVLISDMDERWRRNAANCLVRWSPNLVVHYQLDEMTWLMNGCGGMFHEVASDGDGNPVAGRLADMTPQGEMAQDAWLEASEYQLDHPEEWIKATDLYRALVGERCTR